ncbi:MAG: low molecular weight protein-tyrosine phosphatase [Ilumatobacteraceae bacterium]|jgi:protein-tyrosine phosphatase
MPQPIRVLFVCLGNHCRSPSALAVATHVARLRGTQNVSFDSASIGRDHIGALPHPLASHEGGLRGYHVGHVGRQIHPDDFEQSDLIIAMDRDNVRDLEGLRGGEESRRRSYTSVEPVQVQLLRRWDPFAMPGDEDVDDPWGRPPRAYAEMFDVIERSIPPLIEHLEWLVSESG